MSSAPPRSDASPASQARLRRYCRVMPGSKLNRGSDLQYEGWCQADAAIEGTTGDYAGLTPSRGQTQRAPGGLLLQRLAHIVACRCGDGEQDRGPRHAALALAR